MHYRTKIFLWSSVVITFSFITGIAIYLQSYKNKYFCEECQNPTTVGSLLKVFFIVLYILSAFYVLMVICLFRDQDLSIKIFKITTKVITKNLRMLFLPTIIGGIIVGYIIYWCYTFALLFTTPTLVIPTDYQ